MDKVQVLFDRIPADITGYEMEFEFINPMFSENHFNTGYSFEHTMPWSARNKARFQHANRIDTLRKSEYEYTLLINGFVFFEGIAKVQLSNSRQLKVTVISYGVEFAQKLEAIMLEELDLDEIRIYNESDTVGWKLQKWEDHVMSVMNSDPKQGSHKFPSIQTRGYTGDQDSTNLYHDINQNIVNPYAEGSWRQNWRVPYTAGETTKFDQWPFTVAPCPRLEYLIDKICDRFDITKKVGEIFSETEFLQAFIFAGVVMDEVQRYTTMSGAYYNNVHGSTIKLKNHVPKCSTLEPFNFLFETYGATFFKEKGVLTAVTVKDLMSRKPIIMKSSSMEPDIQTEDYEQVLSVVYEDALKNKMYGGFMAYINANVSTQDLIDTDNAWDGINEDLADSKSQYVLKHQVMKSTFFIMEGYAGSDLNANGETWTWFGNGEYSPRHMYFNGISSVSEDSQYRNEKLYVGLYRGKYTGFQWKFYTGSDPAVPNFIDQFWSYSHDKSLWHPDSISVPFVHNFGKSFYLGMPNGTWQNWLKYYFQNGEMYDTLTIDVSMPVHQLINFCKFQDVKHILQYKSGSIQCIHEKISGRITERGIEDLSFSYRVPKDVLSKGDFNDDFSTDFYN